MSRYFYSKHGQVADWCHQVSYETIIKGQIIFHNYKKPINGKELVQKCDAFLTEKHAVMGTSTKTFIKELSVMNTCETLKKVVI